MMTSKALVVLAAVAVLTSGCGGSSGGNEPAGQSPANPPGTSDAQSPPQQLSIDVSITGGQVNPVNAQLQAKVNEPIVIKVSSDVDEELHVHSTPEHTFEVKAGPPQTFRFSVAVPGRVDVELHHANKTIATIAVQ